MHRCVWDLCALADPLAFDSTVFDLVTAVLGRRQLPVRRVHGRRLLLQQLALQLQQRAHERGSRLRHGVGLPVRGRLLQQCREHRVSRLRGGPLLCQRHAVNVYALALRCVPGGARSQREGRLCSHKLGTAPYRIRKAALLRRTFRHVEVPHLVPGVERGQSHNPAAVSPGRRRPVQTGVLLLPSAAVDKRIESYLHIHLFFEVLHRCRSISPWRPMYLQMVGSDYGVMRFAYVLHMRRQNRVPLSCWYAKPVELVLEIVVHYCFPLLHHASLPQN